MKKPLVDGAEESSVSEFRERGDNESQVKELHAKIRELSMEKDFLSKALGRVQ